MKKTALVVALSVFVLVGGFFLIVAIFGSMTEYNFEEMTTVPAEDAFQSEYDTTDEVTEEETTAETATEPETASEPERSEENTQQESTGDAYEVDLSISMPEKNGTMVTDKSNDNKYIKIVADKKGIDSDLLVAVFAVPESGQNYVFEFYDEENITAANIRRVYLIDSNGKITSVAATKVSEKEGLSSIENWFCMNVLIKEVVFPAISSEIE